MERKSAAVTIGFSAALVIVADLAWATGIGTTAPWFSSEISLTMYAMTLPIAILLAVVLASSAASWAGRMDQALFILDERIAAARHASSDSADRARGMELFDADLEDILTGLDGAGASTEELRETHEAIVQVTKTASPEAARARTETLVGLVSQRISFRAARARAWSTVAGPILASVVFALIAGAMLPGAEGFAQAHFEINTVLILFLGYSWWIVVAWSVTALVLLRVRPSEDLGRTAHR